jgi:hypothetical protein
MFKVFCAEGASAWTASPLDSQALGGLQECHGLNARNLKPFPAPDILARHHIVLAHHIGLRLCKPRAVALVGIAGQVVLFAPYQPAKLVLIGFTAVGTSQHVVPLLSLLIKEIALFHYVTCLRYKLYSMVRRPQGKAQSAQPW